MTTKTITLNKNPSDIHSLSEWDVTKITYNCTACDKPCFYIIQGRWQIKAVKGNDVELVSYDETIKQNDNGNSN